MAQEEEGQIKFRGFLGFTARNESTEQRVPITKLELVEGVNSGWRGQVTLAMKAAGKTSNAYMAGLMVNGLRPGSMAKLEIAVEGEEQSDHAADGGMVLRRWSVMVGSMRPLASRDVNTAACVIEVTDPLTFLRDRPVWGAYRGCSVAEMVGGVLSMAAGGDGKPTQWPGLAGFPTISVSARYRDSLEWLYYAIAAGQPLGSWLANVGALLGVRFELWGLSDGEVVIVVTDGPAGGSAISAHIAGQGGRSASGSTPVELTGIFGKPGEPVRSAMLDDVSQGFFGRVGGGSVGTVMSATGVDLDEVAARLMVAARGRRAEEISLAAQSSQTGVQVGRILQLDYPVWGIKDWQVTGVNHRLRGRAYENSMTLLDAAFPWCPPIPAGAPDIVVPGVVDGGETLRRNAPVPRDRMGRIPVRLAFQPLSGDQAADPDQSDSEAPETPPEEDPGAAEEFADTERWDAEAMAFESGELNDPFPGRTDASLSGEELNERESLSERRENARRYRAWRRRAAGTGEDRDHDGHITLRDSLISDSLQKTLGNDVGRDLLEQWQEAELGGTLETDFPNISTEERALLSEYNRLFGPEAGDDDINDRNAARDAASAAQKWPARLPLPVVNPMAGSMHGFVPAHRQGDACRVVVHNPFSAEIMGFQYREDRPISTDVEQATTGLLVEHDSGQAWSGLVFRPLDSLTEKQT